MYAAPASVDLARLAAAGLDEGQCGIAGSKAGHDKGARLDQVAERCSKRLGETGQPAVEQERLGEGCA